MNVVKCTNGHFFDLDKYDICPHCSAQVASGDNSPHSHRAARRDTNAGRANAGSLKKDAKENKGAVQQTPLPAPSPAPAPASAQSSGSVPAPAAAPASGPAHEASFSGLTTASITIGDFLQDEPPKEQEPQGVFFGGTLKQELESASVSSEQRTLGYFNRLHNRVQDAKPQAETVTGWLVCIGGEHIGESFTLVSGNNLIGRGTDNNIALPRDRGVSNHRHATIIYEPRKRGFYVLPGESSGLTYQNGTLIAALSGLKAGDIIEVGDSRLLFVPLCGSDFTWEDYL